jgi:hypothetical protein
VAPTRTASLAPGSPGPDLVLPGEAAPGGAALTLFEADGCSGVLRVARSGSDLLFDVD